MECLRDYQIQFIDDITNPTLSEQPNRFFIYHNNWRFGLLKALNNTYPVCERVTGKKFFEAMAIQYIKTHFSTFFSLNDYGWDFFKFIENFAPASTLPYLSDVAKLEWAVHKALINIPSKKININKIVKRMNKVEKSINTISVVQNGSLIFSQFPIHKIWETNQDDYEGETTVNLDEGAICLFVWCKELELRIEILDRNSWQFRF